MWRAATGTVSGMRHILLAFLLPLACEVPLAASAANEITGRWLTQTEVQGIAVNETCDLMEAADGALTGSCETSVGTFKVSGKVSGTTVNFSHNARYGGEDGTVSFYGKLDDPTSISGSLDLQPLNAGGAFAMKKQAEK